MTTPNYPGSSSDSPYGAGPSNGQESGYWQDSSYGQSTPSYGQNAAYGAQDTAAFTGSSVSARPGPPSNVGWAVASIVCFWPLAFVAMTRALDVYPLWAAGRHAEAEAASASAKRLGVISIAIVAALVALYVVFIFVMVGLASSGF
ncbi:CD225/dispanin family protein [Dietzia sp. PP-33]|jgi:hypothetical protein|uniref:CD225/dispanin family protein n=1 Tax=Dietzia sp. PP-33 TaxID=2957500 RepID=UPI0029B47747|nr:CD225/dispanin family protein [Dietzia sp. PP-33]MDX2356141.1 CD225/dispanin family protein [Dietzia sp. PP-33]